MKSKNEIEIRKYIGILLAPILSVIVYILPLDLNPDAHIVLSIMVFCLIFWLTEVTPLSITALLGVTLAVVFGIVDVKNAFLSLGNPVLILFIGSFLIAQAMTRHGLDRRFALLLLTRDTFLKSPLRLIVGFSLISFLLSMWISNTATTAMLLPLILGIVETFKKNNIKGVKTFAVYLLLAVAYSASIGGTTTLIGTPTNLIGAGFLKEEGYEIDFLQWIIIVAPISVTMFFILMLYIKFKIRKFRFDKKQVKTIFLKEKRHLPKLSVGEINTLVVFVTAATLWVLPGIANLVGNEVAYRFLKTHLPESIVALICGILLFLLPIDIKKYRGTLDIEDLKKLDWDTILLFGGGIALGKLIINTGLAQYIGKKISSVVSPEFLVGFLFVLIISMIFMTEISSNTATTVTFVPIIIGILKQMNIDIFYPIIAVVVSASFAFMLPIATPPNAIIYGSNLIKITKMAKTGFVLNIIGSIVILTYIIIYMR
ncbi:MAG: DASS family sodium-coupled anion symporter [Aquificae bacterium]|nr:DASS family sodium-coupled anion symporter [Aquificota bacterium]